MREAYLVNLSQSITSVPLYETSPVIVNGRTVQKTQYKALVPNEEFIVGTDISAEKKKYYGQFKPIMIALKFREIVIEEPEDETPDNTNVGDDETGENNDEEPKNTEEVYDEAGLMKKRQDDLIKIATEMGLEATTQDSKAKITKMILEKQLGE